ncbi:hypothetical protein G2494_00210 [Escherichia phage vB_EcoM_G2494]|nr:hypothetical protein G2494_00210 [Escherichia phage vB_EcoM_G2494]HCN7864165.1 hypothetical protein [Escherichia coli]
MYGLKMVAEYKRTGNVMMYRRNSNEDWKPSNRIKSIQTFMNNIKENLFVKRVGAGHWEVYEAV